MPARRKGNVLREQGPQASPGWTQSASQGSWHHQAGTLNRDVLRWNKDWGFYVLGKALCRGSEGGVEKREEVRSSTADMWHRVARACWRQGQEMRIGSKQALTSPDQAVGKGWLLHQGNTLVAWVKNTAARICRGRDRT